MTSDPQPFSPEKAAEEYARTVKHAGFVDPVAAAYLAGATAATAHAQAEIERLTKERDEALAAKMLFMEQALVCAAQRDEAMTSDPALLSSARHGWKKAEMERDTARAEAEKWVATAVLLNRAVEAGDTCVQAARAEAAQLREEVAALRIAFAEASQLAGPAFVAHETLATLRAKLSAAREGHATHAMELTERIAAIATERDDLQRKLAEAEARIEGWRHHVQSIEKLDARNAVESLRQLAEARATAEQMREAMVYAMKGLEKFHSDVLECKEKELPVFPNCPNHVHIHQRLKQAIWMRGLL